MMNDTTWQGHREKVQCYHAFCLKFPSAACFPFFVDCSRVGGAEEKKDALELYQGTSMDKRCSFSPSSLQFLEFCCFVGLSSLLCSEALV